MLNGERKSAHSGVKENGITNSYTETEDLAERISLEEINVELDTNMNEVTRLFKRRRHLIRLKEKLLAVDYQARQENLKRTRSSDLAVELRGSPDKEMQSLLNNLENFAQYRNLINHVWSQSIGNITKLESTKTSEFWNTNKKLESEIDSNLKRLKNCDLSIDKIVNEEFETCTTIDEIEEHIREILRKKEDDHIRKAEPYSIDKSKLLEVLQSKQTEREKVKDQKRQIIKKILALLQALKAHREGRAQAVTGLMYGAQFNLNSYQDYLDALDTIAKCRENMVLYEDGEDKLHQQLEMAAKQSKDLSDIFTQKQSFEALKFAELQNNFRNRIKLMAMQKLFTSDSLPDGATKNLGELVRKCQQYKKILESAMSEESSVKMGLARTKQTIEVFDRILKTIDSEKQRRQRLLHQLEKIQEHHNQLQRDEDKKRNMVVQIQNVRNKKKQLEKHLNELVTQADVTGYKRTMEEITEIDRDIQTRHERFQLLEQQLVSNEHKLIDFTNSIKNDFSDILKEVVPNSWMMNHDLKKFENIFELNVYLKKTFKRLGVV